LGRDVREFKDPTGKAFGDETSTPRRRKVDHERELCVPPPGLDHTGREESYVTRVMARVCGVGYYK